MKNYKLLILITIFLFGCSGSGTTNYDGLWIIDKEISLAECMKSMVDENSGSDAGLMAGFSELICQTITGAIPVLEIEDNKFSISGAQGAQSCSISTESSDVTCAHEADNIEEVMGQISIKDGMLNFLFRGYPDETDEVNDILLVFGKK